MAIDAKRDGRSPRPTLNATAEVPDAVPPEVLAAVGRSVNSQTTTYRYVLLAQLLGKAANNALDCRAVQANAPMPGAFDARSLCQEVVVAFDRDNESVLGGSAEPYANNPLRIPAIISAERDAQKDKRGFDDLQLVLGYAQDNPAQTVGLLRAVLAEVLKRLANVRVVYPTPNRVSQEAARDTVFKFLRERSGGVRLQAVSVALFRAIGAHYQLFDDVRSNNINAADMSTGSAADLECLRKNVVVLAVEVKDRKLTLLHVQDKLPALREKGIKETIFLVQGGITQGERDQVVALIQREFSSGQNIYVAEFMPFLEEHAKLFGESGRRLFLQLICEELEARKTDVSHRQRWRDLLAAI